MTRTAREWRTGRIQRCAGLRPSDAQEQRDRRAEREQRRRDQRQQDVLDHVDAEQGRVVALDRRLEREVDRHEPEQPATDRRRGTGFAGCAAIDRAGPPRVAAAASDAAGPDDRRVERPEPGGRSRQDGAAGGALPWASARPAASASSRRPRPTPGREPRRSAALGRRRGGDHRAPFCPGSAPAPAADAAGPPGRYPDAVGRPTGTPRTAPAIMAASCPDPSTSREDTTPCRSPGSPVAPRDVRRARRRGWSCWPAARSFGPPAAVTTQGQEICDLYDFVFVIAAVDLRPRRRADHLRRRPLPAQADRHRAAAADPRQQRRSRSSGPSSRRSSSPSCSCSRATPSTRSTPSAHDRRPDPGRGRPVPVAFEYLSADGQTVLSPAARARRWTVPGRPDRPPRPALEGRHPRVLRPAVPVQARRRARAATTTSTSRSTPPMPARRSAASAPSCAGRSTARCCSRSRPSARPTTTPGWRPRSPRRQPRPRRRAPRHGGGIRRRAGPASSST